MTKEETLQEKIYNILADFALTVDKCHERGVEPDGQKEIDLIISEINKGYHKGFYEGLTALEKPVKDNITFNRKIRSDGDGRNKKISVPLALNEYLEGDKLYKVTISTLGTLKE